MTREPLKKSNSGEKISLLWGKINIIHNITKTAERKEHADKERKKQNRGRRQKERKKKREGKK
jgi:TusA-related sulfurtransferase